MHSRLCSTQCALLPALMASLALLTAHPCTTSSRFSFLAAAIFPSRYQLAVSWSCRKREQYCPPCCSHCLATQARLMPSSLSLSLRPPSSKLTSLTLTVLSSSLKPLTWKQLPRLKSADLLPSMYPLHPCRPASLGGTSISTMISNSLSSAREEGATRAAYTKWVNTTQLLTEALSLLSSCQCKETTAEKQFCLALASQQASLRVWKRSARRQRRLASLRGLEVALRRKLVSETKTEELRNFSLKKLSTASLLPGFLLAPFSLEYSPSMLSKLARSSSFRNRLKYSRQSSLPSLELPYVRARMLALSLLRASTPWGSKKRREVRESCCQALTALVTSWQLKQALVTLGKSLMRLPARVLLPQKRRMRSTLSLSCRNLNSSSLREAAQMSPSLLPSHPATCALSSSKDASPSTSKSSLNLAMQSLFSWPCILASTHRQKGGGQSQRVPASRASASKACDLFIPIQQYNKQQQHDQAQGHPQVQRARR